MFAPWDKFCGLIFEKLGLGKYGIKKGRGGV
jgi:hypothetical protein